MEESDWANTMNLPLLSDEKLSELKKASCSESNFAVQLLVRELFSDDELVNKNVQGRKGKQALDTENACFKLEMLTLDFTLVKVVKKKKLSKLSINAFLQQKNKVLK